MTYPLCGCEKDEKQEKDIETEKNHSRKHRLNATHTHDKTMYFY